MLVTNNTITLEIPPPIELANRLDDAVLFQLNGLLYTGYCDLVPKTDPKHPDTLWYRITECRCHGLVEDAEAKAQAIWRLQFLSNQLEF